MWVKLATGSCHEQKSSNCPHQKVLITSGTKKKLIWHEGVPSCLCALIMLALKLQVRPGFLELCIARMLCWCGGSGRTLCRHDFWYHAPSIGPPVLFSQLMNWRTQVEWWAQSGWRRGCRCVKDCWLCGGGLARRKGVVWLWNVIDVIMCLDQAVLYYWHCGLLVVNWNFLESGPPWWWCVGVFCQLPVY